jgi:hypothetical protein
VCADGYGYADDATENTNPQTGRAVAPLRQPVHRQYASGLEPLVVCTILYANARGAVRGAASVRESDMAC